MVNGACAVKVPPEKKEDAIFEIAGGRLSHFVTEREDYPRKSLCRPYPARQCEVLVSQKCVAGHLL